MINAMKRMYDSMQQLVNTTHRMVGKMHDLEATTHRIVGETRDMEVITDELRDHIADFDDFWRPVRNYFYWEPHCLRHSDLLVVEIHIRRDGRCRPG